MGDWSTVNGKYSKLSEAMMVKTGGLSVNTNAFNLISYTRPDTDNTALYFQQRPQGGYSRVSDMLSASNARPLHEAGLQTLMKPGSTFAAPARDTGRGAVVPLLESVYPSATMFNVATGAWTSAQAESALATVDRANVFRALEKIKGKDAATTVVESPSRLVDAINRVSAYSNTAVIASSASPGCSVISALNAKEPPASPAEIFEAAIATSQDRRLIVLPFMGLKAGQREICCDGIVADGKVVFSAFSEKRKVDPEPPYSDRRITTADNLDDRARKDLTTVVAQVLDELGVKNCVFHSEHCFTDKGPQLSDLMTRPGGGFIPEMVLAKHGVDLRVAHVYASFAMKADLTRIAKEARDTGKGVAIAACYVKRTGKTPAKPVSALVNRLVGDKAVLAYNVVGAFSNSVVGNPDLQASLAVVGSNADAALRHLDETVGAYGLE